MRPRCDSSSSVASCGPPVGENRAPCDFPPVLSAEGGRGDAVDFEFSSVTTGCDPWRLHEHYHHPVNAVRVVGGTLKACADREAIDFRREACLSKILRQFVRIGHGEGDKVPRT